MKNKIKLLLPKTNYILKEMEKYDMSIRMILLFLCIVCVNYVNAKHPMKRIAPSLPMMKERTFIRTSPYR